MWECEGEKGCARVHVCVLCVSQVHTIDRCKLFLFCSFRSNSSLLIAIIASHLHHHWFNQYIAIQVYLYIYIQRLIFVFLRESSVTHPAHVLTMIYIGFVILHPAHVLIMSSSCPHHDLHRVCNTSRSCPHHDLQQGLYCV